MEYTNSDIVHKHLCSPYGGIRKSNRKQCIVLIINERSGYRDIIKNGGSVINFIGQGLTGDQTLTRNNKALAETTWPIYLYHRESKGPYQFIGNYIVEKYRYAKQDNRIVLIFKIVKL